MPPPPGYAPYAPGQVPSPSTGATAATDVAALSNVFWAALLMLLGGVVDIVLLAVGNLSRLVTATSTAGQVTLSLPNPWLWVGILSLAAVFSLLSLFLLRGAFHGLSGIDPNFRTPALLSLLALVGVALLLVGAALVLHGLYVAVSCVGAGNPITRACLLTSSFWAGVALAGIGGVLALVGLIGVLLGLWRVGTRYNDTLIHVATILLIFPYVNVVASALLLASMQSQRRRIGSMAGVPPTAV